MIWKAGFTALIVAWALLSWYGDMKGWSIRNMIPIREEDNDEGRGDESQADVWPYFRPR